MISFIPKLTNLFLILLLAVIYFFFFHEKAIKQTIPAEIAVGCLFDTETASAPVTNPNIPREVTLYSDQGKLPTISFYSEVRLPDTFLGKLSASRSLADYVAVSASDLKSYGLFEFFTKQELAAPAKSTATVLASAAAQTPLDKKVQRKETQRKDTKALTPSPLAKTPKDTQKKEDLNPYVLEELIRDSDKTYYFSQKSLSKEGITLQLLSLTPQSSGNGFIVKFQLTNNTGRFFIPQSVVVFYEKKEIPHQLFLKQMCNPGESLTGYLIVLTQEKQLLGKSFFQLTEFGGEYKKFTIFF